MLISAASAQAHEFWISPESYQIAPDDPIRADIRVGQNLKGSAYAYIPKRFERFDLIVGDSVIPVEGRMGDRPAMVTIPPESGMAIVVHETTDTILTYTDWDKFLTFVTDKHFPDALEQHAARGLPETGFRESYRRFAKSLIAVGDGAGTDRPVGLETEIVALSNPYTDDMTNGLPVQVLYNGSPRQNAQVEVFDKAPDGKVTVTQIFTDPLGHATIPVARGHEYLLDAVILRSTGNDDFEAGPVWHSLWAALTFQVPGE
ncbi:DUF4198 domain-containing protein [Actibacterium lipolyticum]|uniref:Nickel uptake substrate-specific transmembrane region n=1 Tax=Actibacterium lipolyticum TaxID=1524263 RepID=A0A238KV88_9RHOB|nr:DUF4198 domain-containing protein [Actibacterium lipolyticum]SMX46764.1 Nickel uptake substrate-specific transmembrane region [Actibacterium lipolyticum]